MSTISDQDIEAINQRICGELVRREVYHCASSLIHHFASNPESLNGSDFDWDADILPLCQGEDWQTGFEESEFRLVETSEGDWFAVPQTDAVLIGFMELADRDSALADHIAIDDPEDWQAICEACDIEPQQVEAYEHWIVSKWFAGKLAEYGELIGEVFDFHIWGRCCTGQAIALDHVIRSIAASMEILYGQANEWKV